MSNGPTTKTFDFDSGVFTGYYDESPNVTVVCEAWRLFFVQPDVEEVPDGANKTAAAEINKRNEESHLAAINAAKAAYAAAPMPLKNVIYHGIGKGGIVGDKLNTSGKETLEERVQDCRDVWQAALSGERVHRGGKVDPKTKLRRSVLENAAVNAKILSQTEAARMAKDDSAKLIAMIAKARGMTAKDFETSVDASVAVLG